MTDEHVPRTTIGDTIDHVVGRVTAGVVDWLFRGVLGAPLVVEYIAGDHMDSLEAGIARVVELVRDDLEPPP